MGKQNSYDEVLDIINAKIKEIETPVSIVSKEPTISPIQSSIMSASATTGTHEYLTKDTIRKIYPKANNLDVDIFHKTFNAQALENGLTNPESQHIFFGQTKHESAGKIFAGDENMNYSEAGLKATFSIYAKNPELAKTHGRREGQDANQRAIADTAYGRLGGYNFRGFGNIQVTGKDNYTRVAKRLGISLDDLVKNKTSKDLQLSTAMAYFGANKISDAKTFDDATNIINKGESKDKRMEGRNLIYNSLTPLFSTRKSMI